MVCRIIGIIEIVLRPIVLLVTFVVVAAAVIEKKNGGGKMHRIRLQEGDLLRQLFFSQTIITAGGAEVERSEGLATPLFEKSRRQKNRSPLAARENFRRKPLAPQQNLFDIDL